MGPFLEQTGSSQEKGAFQGNRLSPPFFNMNITELAAQLEQIPSPVLTLNKEGIYPPNQGG